MKDSFKTGFSFGLTSGIITTLGLMVGLEAGTQSKIAVAGGILTIAIADAFSDALGIHISQEAQTTHSVRHIWEATVATFLAKFFFALTFILPVLAFELTQAVTVSVVWGLAILALFSFLIGRKQGESPVKVVSEHVVIALLVVLVTHGLGHLMAAYFG